MSSSTPIDSISSASNPKQEPAQGFIDRQLARAAAQIRLFDLLGTLLIWCTAILGSLMLVVVIDAWIYPLGSIGRWLVLLALALGSIAYLGWRLAPLMLKRINPMYAARMLDEGHPELKDGLVNVVSLRTQPELVRQRIFSLLTNRTASDLSKLQIDSAIDRSQVIRVGYILATLMALAFAYKLFSPKDPLTTLARIATPSADVPPPSRVRIVEVTPGNAQVRFGESLEVEADIKGLSDQATATIRYTTDDHRAIDASVPMTWDEATQRYRATFASGTTGIEGSLDYRVEAGDAQSPTYRVEVQTRPTTAIERITLRPQSYTLLAERSWTDRGDIEGLEGSEIEIAAIANVPVSKMVLELLAPSSRDQTTNDQDRPAAKRIPMTVNEQHGVVSFRLELSEDRVTPKYDAYRIQILTASGEVDTRPVHYRINVLPDLAPSIRWVAPQTKELRLRLDQRLELETEAFDADFHISKVELIGEVRGAQILSEQLLDASRTQDGRHTGRLRFQPNNYRLAAGDTVVLFARAFDDRHHSTSLQSDPNMTQTEHLIVHIDGPSSDRNGNNNGNASDSPNGQAPSAPSQGGEANEGNPQTGGGTSSEEGGEAGSSESQPQQGTGSGGSSEEQQQESGEAGSPPPSGGSGSGSGQANSSSSEPSQGGGSDSGNESSSENSSSNPSGQGSNAPAGEGERNTGEGGGQSTESMEGSQPQDSTGSDPTATPTPTGSENPTGANNNSSSSNPSQPQNGNENASDPGSLDNSEAGSNDNSSSSSDSQSNPAPPKHEGEAFDRILEHMRREGKTDPLDQDGSPSNPNSAQSPNANPPSNGDSESRADGSNRPQQNSSNQAPSNRNQDGANGSESEPSGDSPSEGGESEGSQSEGSQSEGSQSSDSEGQGNSNQAPTNPAGNSESPSSNSNNSESGDAPMPGSNSSEGNPTGSPQSNPTDSNSANDASDSGSNESQAPGSSQGDSGETNDPGMNESGSQEAPQSNDDSNASSTDSGEGSDPTAGEDSAGEGSEGEGAEAGQNSDSSSDSGSAPDRTGSPSGNSNSRGSESGSESGSEGEEGLESESSNEPSSSEEGSGAPSRDPGAASPSGSSGPQPDPSNQSDSSQQGARPGDRNRNSFGPGNPDGELPPGEAANLDYAKRATDLVLEYLKDQEQAPSEDLLRDLDWTPEQLKQFRERWEQMRNAAQQGSADDQRRLDDRLRSLGLMPPSSAPIRSERAADGVRGLGQDGSRTAPPPEFADRFRQFLRGVSQADSQQRDADNAGSRTGDSTDR